MSNEYIRKQDAIDAIWHSIDGNLGELESYTKAVIGDAEDAIKSLDPADVASVAHAHWIDGYKWQTCSKCRNKGKKSWKFCNNCGAKADEHREEKTG